MSWNYNLNLLNHWKKVERYFTWFQFSFAWKSVSFCIYQEVWVSSLTQWMTQNWLTMNWTIWYWFEHCFLSIPCQTIYDIFTSEGWIRINDHGIIRKKRFIIHLKLLMIIKKSNYQIILSKCWPSFFHLLKFFSLFFCSWWKWKFFLLSIVWLLASRTRARRF